jgi:transposase, IS5 family
VIDMRRAQLKFSDHWVAEEVDGLREDWMRRADQILDDEVILTAVYEALSKRHPKSRSRGREIAAGVKRSMNPLAQLKLEGLRQTLDQMVPCVKQVMKQTRARIHRGDTRSEDKLLSVFEPSTEIIRKGKSGKPNEFGKMVKLQEAENQIVIDFEVYDRRPSDSDLLVPAIDAHQAAVGRVPYLLAADAAFYSRKNEAAARSKGVKRICVPKGV